MTNIEMSNEFDVLYQNITSNQAPGLDEYEKSVFLTKAEKIIVRRQFDPNSDKLREGFDGSQQRQYDFSTLITTENLNNLTSSVLPTEKIDSRSSVFMWPEKCFLAVNEIITDNKGNQYSVNPISYDTYARLMTKPYQFPPKRIAWRMMTNNQKSGWTNGNFGGKLFTLPLSADYLQWVKTIVSSSNVTKAALAIYVYKKDDQSENAIDIYALPEVDGDTAIVNIEISVNRNSNLYTYDLGKILKIIADSANAPAYIVWNTDHFGPSSEAGSTESYVISATNNQLYKLFNEYLNAIDFPITCADIDKYGDLIEGETDFYATFKCGEVASGTLIEIIGRFQNQDNTLSTSAIDKHMLRYVETLKPIVLVDLKDQGLSIDGVDEVTECQLPVECHQEILELAVSLAKVAMLGSTETLASSQNNKE